MFSKWRISVIFALSIFLVLIIGSYAAEWKKEDIGTVGGSDDYDAKTGQWTIHADGADIWDVTDGFRYIYQQVSGDFEISARLVSLQNTNGWAKAGVMARGSNTPVSWFAWSFVTVGNGTTFQWRLVDKERCWPDGAGLAGAAPYFVKTVRKGSIFSGYRSLDGVKWENNNSVAQPNNVEIKNITDPILVGLASTSHSAGAICKAEFDSLEASFLPKAVKPGGKATTTWAEIKNRH